MFRRILLTTSFTTLLLAATPALPSPVLAAQQTSAVSASQSRLAAVTQSYFVALNDSLATGNFSGLRAILAARATLTERSSLTLLEPSPQITTVHGRSAVIHFYRHLSAHVAGSRWIVGVMNQVSPTTMVAYARIVGAQNTPLLYATQRLTMRSGKITSVDLTLFYVK
jgi:hypothetical protein